MMRKACFSGAMLIAMGVSLASLAWAAGKSGEAFPDVRFIKTEGGDERLAFSDANLTVIDCWATWCKPCLVQAETLAEMHSSLKARGISVVALNMVEDAGKVKRFLEKRNWPFKVLLATDDVAQALAIRTIPRTFMVDRKGVIRFEHEGLLPRKELESAVNDALTAKKE